MTKRSKLSMKELLDYVAKGNLPKIRESLISCGFPATDGEITDIQLLQTALKTKNRDIAKLLIKFGCSVNDSRYLSYTSPLYLAVAMGDIVIVRMLLYKGADIDVKSSGQTCLHLAAEGQFDILKLLLEHKCNVNLCNRHGNTVLQVLLDYAKKDKADNEKLLKEIVLKLLQKGAKIYSMDEKRQTPIHVASMIKKKGILSIILSHCNNVNIYDDDDNSPLHFLLKYNSGQDEQIILRLLQQMLDRGAKLKAANKDGDTPLHLAAENKLFSVVSFLLNFSLDINICDKEGRNVLHRIIGNNIEKHEAEKFKRVVEIMISKGIFIHKRTNNGETPLHLAAKYCNKYGLDALFRHNVNVTVVDNEGNTALHKLVDNDIVEDCSDMMHMLLTRCSVRDRNKQGEMPIHLAAKRKKINDIKILVQYHQDLNTCDDNRNSILYNLLEGIPSGKESLKYLEIINLLLSKKVLMRPCLELIATSLSREIFCFLINQSKILIIRDYKLNTLLHILIEKNKEPDILEPLNLILSCEADVNSENFMRETALHLAVKNQQINVVKILLRYGANATICTKQGYSALHLLSLETNHNTTLTNDMVALLTNHGCDVDLMNEREETPLYLALRTGSLIMADTLLQHNANINLKRSDCSTYLHLAVENLNDQMLEMLLKLASKFKLNIDAKRKDGKSALHIATHLCESNKIQMLLDYGADIESQDDNGKTVLHWACWKEDSDVVSTLLKFGANVNAKDNNGINPVHLLSKISRNYWDNILMDLTIHIGMLIAAGLFVTDANKQFYESNSLLLFKDSVLVYNLKAECNLELKTMKSFDIGSHKSLYDIIQMKQNTCFISQNHLALKEILNTNFLNDILEIYWYSDMIKSYYKRAVRRKKLAQTSIDSFKQINEFPIPDECCWEIFNYLSNENLRNVIEAASSLNIDESEHFYVNW